MSVGVTGVGASDSGRMGNTVAEAPWSPVIARVSDASRFPRTTSRCRWVVPPPSYEERVKNVPELEMVSPMVDRSMSHA